LRTINRTWCDGHAGPTLGEMRQIVSAITHTANNLYNKKASDKVNSAIAEPQE
jgi:hypothetical protein